MKEDQDKWINDVFENLNGNQRAVPDPALLAKIEAEIHSSSGPVVSLFNWKNYAAAAAIILLFNALSLVRYSHSSTISYEEVAMDAKNQSLISSYKIYK